MGGSVFKSLLPVALSVVAPGIGTAVGTALGAGASFAPIVGGALLGAGTSALTGGNPLTGALSGGLGGIMAGPMGASMRGGLSDMLGGADTMAGRLIGGAAVDGGGSFGDIIAHQASQSPLTQALTSSSGSILSPVITNSSSGSEFFNNLLTNIQNKPFENLGLGLNVIDALNQSGQEADAIKAMNEQLANQKALNEKNAGMMLDFTPMDRKLADTSNFNFSSYAQNPGGQQLFFDNVNPEWGPRLAKGGQVKQSPLAVLGSTLGQNDDVPAMLSDGEYVIPADVVAHQGDGNTQAGAKKLDEYVKGIRKQKTGKATKKLPPKAKPVVQYVKSRRVKRGA